MPFDPESGQLYEETVASLPAKDEDDLVYINIPGHVRARPQKRVSSKGTRRLYTMAMLTILRNLDLLYFDLLKAFPVPILEQIWKAIDRKGLAGLRVWKLFAPLLGPAGTRQLMTRSVVKRPRSFAHAINQGISVDSAWLTVLTLDAMPLSMAEYVQVSSIPNLCSLAVLAGPRRDADFSDRVLRAWASDARMGSFKRLRQILISGCRYVTEQSLSYMSSFEALQLFCVHDCRFYTGGFGHIHAKDNASKPEWQDLPHGAFREFLRTKAASFGRGRYEAPSPSSFHLYTTQRVREDPERSGLPHLLMTLLPESRRDERATVFDRPPLHCFERVGDLSVVTKPSRVTSLEPVSKRRKLKDGKTKAVEHMLEGFS